MKSNLISGPEQVMTDIAVTYDFLRRYTMHIYKLNLMCKSYGCYFVGFQV